MIFAPLRRGMVLDGERRAMVVQTARYQDTLRRLAIFDEGLVETGWNIHPVGASELDARTEALLRVAVSVATGSSPVCLHWSAARALAAGASKDEIVDVLLAIVPVAGLGRVVSAAPHVATALEYDIEAALEAPDDRPPRGRTAGSTPISDPGAR